MLAKEFYNKIIEMCNATQVNKSGKNAKWVLYRVIKNIGAEYKTRSESERMKSGSNRVSDDEIKIHMMLSVIKKDKFTDAMTFEEFRQHIIKTTTAIINS